MTNIEKNSKFLRRKLNELGENVPLNVFYLPLAKENAVLRKEGKFRCRFCKEIFPTEQKVYNKNYCRPCQTSDIKARYDKHKKNLTLDTLLVKRLRAAKFRAKQKKIDFDLDLSYLLEIHHQQKSMCAYSRKPMAIALNKVNSVSIDRIDSSKGYVKGNVCLSWAIVNCMKGDLSVKDFVALCESIKPPVP